MAGCVPCGDDIITLSHLRGKELRKVKSHVKVEVLLGKWSKYVVLLGVKVKAYSDELKMLSQILASIGDRISAKYFLADRYYSKAELIMSLEEKGIKCVIPAGGSVRKKVRNEHRKMAQRRYEERREVYRHRRSVERVIGIIKNKWGDRDRTKKEELAKVYVPARFVLWNMCVLMKVKFLLYFSVLRARWFLMIDLQRFEISQTSSCQIAKTNLLRKAMEVCE